MRPRSFLLFSLIVSAVASALPSERYATSSRLAEGLWVKVATDTTGIYEISYDQLRQWGFEHPERVRVYGYGGVAAASHALDGSVADDVPPAPAMHAEGKLIFYAEGEVRAELTGLSTLRFTRNYYTTGATYLLNDSHGDATPIVKPYNADLSATDTHVSVSLVEQELFSPSGGGALRHGPAITNDQKEPVEFAIRDYSTTGGVTAFFHCDLAVDAPRTYRPQIEYPPSARIFGAVSVAAKTNTVPYVTYYDASASAYFGEAAPGSLADAVFSVTVAMPPDFEGKYAAIDKAYIAYPRKSRLRSFSELMMEMGDGAPRNMTIGDAEADVCVWDVGNPTCFITHQTSYEAATRTATVSIDGPGKFVAFNASAPHRKPVFAGEVPNSDIHATQTPDMLIVTTEELRGAALDMAAIHREARGANVVVFTQEEIFNEFSGGVRTPAAIRRCVKMFYERRPGKLRHLLLYGHSDWNKGTGLVPFECELATDARRTTSNYASDQYFGMIADHYDPQRISSMEQQVSVGRLPVADEQSARICNDKSRRRLAGSPSPNAYLRMLKLSDDGDNRSHFDTSEAFATAILDANGAFTVVRADNLLYPWTDNTAREARRKIAASLTGGCGLMMYAGHGSPHGLTAERLYTPDFVAANRYDTWPLAVLASCETFPFDREASSIASQMVMAPDGGAIGVVGACRSVYMDFNRRLGVAIAEAYAVAAPDESGADIMRKARNKLVAGGMEGDFGANTLCYNYCGDPALPLGAPGASMALTLPAEGLVAGEPATIEATVTYADGSVMKDFKGMALIEMYDAPMQVTTLVRNADDGPATTVACADRLLAEYPAEVVDGRCVARIVMPRPQGRGPMRIVAGAIDTATGRSAAGGVDGIAVAPAKDIATEAEPPHIIAFGIDPAYIDENGAVGADFVVHAEIEPSAAGIATAQSGLCSGLSLTIDGKTTVPDVRRMMRYGPDGTASVDVTLRGMAQGRHSLRLEVIDNCGRKASATVEVMVSYGALHGTLTADEADPARLSAVLRLDAPPCTATLLILDNDGNTVRRQPGCEFPFVWNLLDDSGQPVPDGRYTARAMLSSANATGSTPDTEIIVLKMR